MDRTREFTQLILACRPSPEGPTSVQPLPQKPAIANISDEYTQEAYRIVISKPRN
jgi:hypothetical protein